MTTCGTNTTPLSTNKFKIVMERFPNTEMFSQAVVMPAVTLGASIRPTNTWVDYKLAGDKVEFDDLIISIIIDEDLQGYGEILAWMKDCADSELDPLYSDITVIGLSGQYNENKRFKFYNCFPYNIGNVVFDVRATEDVPLTVDVIFKFSHFLVE